jgi:predicted SnoaL-like aldol condensation-catalyzing enzyme
MENSQAENNKALVIEAVTSVFIERENSTFERYFVEDYIQHNPMIPPGRDGLKNFVATFPPTFNYSYGMVIAEGDLVMIHGRYAGVAPNPLLACDIFRVANGKLVEHWDVVQEEVPVEKTVAGNPMFTGVEANK